MSLAELTEFQTRYPERVLSVGGAEWRIRQTCTSSINLMLLPGAQGTGDVFFKTALELGSRINCITVTPPAWSEIDLLAEALQGVLDAIALAKVDLLGSSLSGYLAQVFATRHAERIGSLLLTSTFFDAGEIQKAMPSPEQLAKLSPEVVAKELPVWLIPENLRAVGSNEVKSVLGTMVGATQPLATLKSRALALALARPVGRVPIPDERVVIIDADDDPVIPQRTRQALRDRYHGATRHSISGGGHYPAILRPEAFAGAITQTLLGSAALSHL